MTLTEYSLFPKSNLQCPPNHASGRKFNIFLERTRTKNTAQNASEHAISSGNFFLGRGLALYPDPSPGGEGQSLHTHHPSPPPSLLDLPLYPLEFQPDVRDCSDTVD